MPKDTFFRLPDDKRNRILIELSRTQKYHEAVFISISKTRKIYICTLLKKI